MEELKSGMASTAPKDVTFREALEYPETMVTYIRRKFCFDSSERAIHPRRTPACSVVDRRLRESHHLVYDEDAFQYEVPCSRNIARAECKPPSTLDEILYPIFFPAA